MAGMDHWQESVGRLLWDREIPLSVCVPYTLFVCILVPVYWRYYGPANFLWFSDLALLIGLAALWLESVELAHEDQMANCRNGNGRQ